MYLKTLLKKGSVRLKGWSLFFYQTLTLFGVLSIYSKGWIVGWMDYTRVKTLFLYLFNIKFSKKDEFIFNPSITFGRFFAHSKLKET